MERRLYLRRNTSYILFATGLGLLVVAFTASSTVLRALAALLAVLVAAGGVRQLFWPRRARLELTADALIWRTFSNSRSYSWIDCGPFSSARTTLLTGGHSLLMFAHGEAGMAKRMVRIGSFWDDGGDDLPAVLNHYREEALKRQQKS